MDGADLRGLEWDGQQERGAPVVYVSEGRQANYASRVKCGRGHFLLDTCGKNSTRYRFPIVRAAQNIGSRSSPLGSREGCVDARHAGWSSTMPKAGAIECLWSARSQFHGWQDSTGPGATPYGRYLVEVVIF
jgi:hypothetical protein